MKGVFWIFTIVLIVCSLTKLNSQQLAFPGAEGFGAYTTGGRGGVVYEVTHLNDDETTGSLRKAVKATGPRTIVFRVSGTIALTKALEIKNDYITIAGQTAPGDGICLKNYPLEVEANNVIIRYIRCRLGDVSLTESDAMTGRNRKDIIIDHCSMSWSVDETGSFYDNDNFTMQWCILSESLYHSLHEKGDHGYGGIWGGRNVTFHHNLLAHHTSRNPRFCGARYHYNLIGQENVDHRNNVIFNWGGNSAYGGENGHQNMIANYYKPGPGTKSHPERIVEASDNLGVWYVDENFVVGEPLISANNWNGGVDGTAQRSYVPFPFAPVITQTAEEAYLLVLEHAGATLPKRDTIDRRIVKEVKTGVCTYGDTWGANSGIIDTQGSVGGWPVLNSTTPPTDTDHDGMPDDWEDANNLDKNNAADRNTISASGYTMLEEYLNSLVTPLYTDNVILTSEVIGNGKVNIDSNQYYKGAALYLKATPDSGYIFDGWSGDFTSTDTVVSIILDSNIHLNATFKVIPKFNFTSIVIGKGKVNIENGEFVMGTVINLEATPDSGYVFDGWSGDFTGSESIISLVLDSNIQLTASFVLDTSVDINSYGNIEFSNLNIYGIYHDFNTGKIQIKFNLQKQTKLSVNLIDISGKFVSNALNGNFERGINTIEINNSSLKSGVYIMQFKTNEQVITKKFLIK